MAPEIVETVATGGEASTSCGRAVARHRGHLAAPGLLAARRSHRLAQELRRVLLARTEVKIDELAAGEEFTTAVKALVAGELDPYEAADRLLGRMSRVRTGSGTVRRWLRPSSPWSGVPTAWR